MPLEGTPNPMEIGPATLETPYRTLYVTIDGYRFMAAGKHTILDLGWALFLPESHVPKAWIRKNGETRPADDGWSELASDTSGLITTHPVLVALSLQARWHCNGRPIPTVPVVLIPTFDEAVEIVRSREILNSFNRRFAGEVPGELKWRSSAQS